MIGIRRGKRIRLQLPLPIAHSSLPSSLDRLDPSHNASDKLPLGRDPFSRLGLFPVAECIVLDVIAAQLNNPARRNFVNESVYLWHILQKSSVTSRQVRLTFRVSIRGEQRLPVRGALIVQPL